MKWLKAMANGRLYEVEVISLFIFIVLGGRSRVKNGGDVPSE